MQITRSKTTYTAKPGINPSNLTLLRMVLAGIGFFGIVVFGFLMEKSLAPFRGATGASAGNGFNSFGDSLIIPGFLLSVFLCTYSVYELYKVYRKLNDPRSYGNKSRRSSI